MTGCQRLLVVSAFISMASQIKCARWAYNCGTWFPSESDWLLLSSGIDDEDKKRIGKFVFQKDVKCAMVGRYLIKKFIVETTGLNWKDIKILRDSIHNKPYFRHNLYPRIQFNISHSGEYVVFAGEIGYVDLGIDLMKVEKQRRTSVPEFFRLMTNQFSTEEWRVIHLLSSESEQMAMFYRFWCLKESYTKATGTGITVDLQEISFKLNTLILQRDSFVEDTEVYVEGIKQVGWKFQETLLDDSHIATVALHEHHSSPITDSPLFKTISYDELVSRFEPVSEPDIAYCQQLMAKRNNP